MCNFYSLSNIFHYLYFLLKYLPLKAMYYCLCLLFIVIALHLRNNNIIIK